MQSQDILYFQGFGARRVCAGLVQQGRFRFMSQMRLQPPSFVLFELLIL